MKKVWVPMGRWVFQLHLVLSGPSLPSRFGTIASELSYQYDIPLHEVPTPQTPLRGCHKAQLVPYRTSLNFHLLNRGGHHLFPIG